ncbi:MAG: NYN domain-containing protein, partial [Oscillospiraceae bacterium]|nr:NYN domain-containing protein [Oscillospiraceae bacterium]
QRMGAEFSQPMADNEHSIIEGRCPISEIQGYSADMTGYTHGTGRLSTVLDGYYPCHNQDEIVEKIGYNFQNDVENSADSIFCSHGAGYLVKWNEVPNKMHIPSVLCSNRVTVTDSEISSYKKRIATDKELMEIFERTYGKINRSERTAMRRDKPLEQNYKSHEPSTATEYLLVDGYNIIFSWNELSEIARDNLDLARTRLINLMCNYQGFKRCNLILVFDAYKIKSDREIEHFGDVTVVYTKHAETADNYIERTAHKLAGNNRVRVATSDGTEQTIILGQGALRISAREFKLEVDEVMETIRKVLDENR